MMVNGAAGATRLFDFHSLRVLILALVGTALRSNHHLYVYYYAANN